MFAQELIASARELTRVRSRDDDARGDSSTETRVLALLVAECDAFMPAIECCEARAALESAVGQWTTSRARETVLTDSVSYVCWIVRHLTNTRLCAVAGCVCCGFGPR